MCTYTYVQNAFIYVSTFMNIFVAMHADKI